MIVILPQCQSPPHIPQSRRSKVKEYADRLNWDQRQAVVKHWVKTTFYKGKEASHD